ncbi:hypothetical protein QE152_g33622 [Popillia japonica]|uniref:Uncharacterized protein n=1 Tax=Popillia japonica TaxID=7064 RepID=A0AAW1IWF1_POPJA
MANHLEAYILAIKTLTSVRLETPNNDHNTSKEVENASASPPTYLTPRRTRLKKNLNKCEKVKLKPLLQEAVYIKTTMQETAAAEFWKLTTSIKGRSLNKKRYNTNNVNFQTELSCNLQNIIRTALAFINYKF